MPTMIFSSVFKNTGTAKATGNPFSIPRANVLVPFLGRNSATFQSNGVGLVPIELSVGESCFDALLSSFTSKFKGLPVPIDVDTSMGEGGITVIIGVRAPS